MNEHQVAETARDAGETIKETAQDWTEKARGSVRDAGAAADLYLHEYAWTSALVIALAAGLLGYFLAVCRRA